MDDSRNSPVTYVIGRSADADIVLSDLTVSRLHAELVCGADGRWYLTDRCSTGGTWLLDAGEWIPIEQDYVRAGDRLRLGGLECTLEDLLRLVPSGGKAGGRAASAGRVGTMVDGTESVVTVSDDRPAGAVVRDWKTGEVRPREGN